MSDQMLRIVAFMKLKPGSMQWALENGFKDLVENTRKEEGCISYIVHEDLKDKNILIFVEEWKNQAAIDFHRNTPHLKAAFRKLRDHFEIQPDIRIVKPLL